jgi:hypothetical protein
LNEAAGAKEEKKQRKERRAVVSVGEFQMKTS